MTLRELYNYLLEAMLLCEEEREAKAITYRVLEYFTGYDKLNISLSPQKEIPLYIVNRVKKALVALQKHTPVQYITGEAFFCGLRLKVNRQVLIPRQETEELAYWIINENKSFEGEIIDLGTGSGCLAIALALHFPKANVFGIDINKKALKLAQTNAKHHHVNVVFKHCDILSDDFMNYSGKGYDIVVSNPPYVRCSEKQFMKENVLDYEPSNALFVPDDNPLIYYQSLTKWASKYLNENGKLYLEINEALHDEMKDLLAAYQLQDICLKKDFNAKYRMIKGYKKQKIIERN